VFYRNRLHLTPLLKKKSAEDLRKGDDLPKINTDSPNPTKRSDGSLQLPTLDIPAIKKTMICISITVTI
jgi:hypothetical protein